MTAGALDGYACDSHVTPWHRGPFTHTFWILFFDSLYQGDEILELKYLGWFLVLWGRKELTAVMVLGKAYHAGRIENE